MRESYKYWPYLWRERFGSSASLKSSSKPRFWRELKKIEWEDLRAKSSSNTKMRRSVGFSGENESMNIGRREINIKRKMEQRFAIFVLLGFQGRDFVTRLKECWVQPSKKTELILMHFVHFGFRPIISLLFLFTYLNWKRIDTLNITENK